MLHKNSEEYITFYNHEFLVFQIEDIRKPVIVIKILFY